MSVTEVLNNLGEFEFELGTTVPRDVLDSIQYFGHIALIPGRVDPKQYGDSLLSAARYVGVVRRKTLGDDGRTNAVQDNIRIGGVGMAFWLGDEDGKGDVYETAQTFTAQGFSSVLTALLPDAVTPGTFGTVAGTYTGSHQYETPRSAIQYVCDTMSTTSVPVTWRVNGNATLDAGPHTDLFVTDPKCIIIRKGSTPGNDMFMRSLQGSVDYTEDMEDFNTRVVMLGEGSGDTFATGTADIDGLLNPYKDVHGNPLKLTRLVSESDTLEDNADTRAALALNQYSSSNKDFQFSTYDYDVHGTFDVGDYVYVYDPDLGLVNTANEVQFRGVLLNPVKVQVTESTWSITEDFTVAYRDVNGVWSDLTDNIHFEEVTANKVVVGDPTRKLITSSDSTIAVRSGIVTDTNNSIPDAPDWVTASFETTAYLDNQGYAKARQKLVWDEPLNTDSTAITDGSFYEIQYRLDAGAVLDVTWGDLAALNWDQLNTWDAPILADNVQWQSVFVGWGETSTVVHELATGTDYVFRIRAVDIGGNQSDWSTQETVTTSQDNIPPSTPDAPTVAGSLVAIQVTHDLGKATGGTFNLENDLAALEVHYSYDNGFTPTDATKAGMLRANQGMMASQVPAVGTFPISETGEVYVRVVAVDLSGNRSSPSNAAAVTAELIDDSHISNLTVTKLLAGTISSDWILGASIKTGVSGARVELNSSGLQAFNSEGDQTVDISSDDGSVSLIGHLTSGTTGQRIEINPTDSVSPEIRFWPDESASYAYLKVYDVDEETDFISNPVILSSNVWTGDDGNGIHDYEARLWLASGPTAGVNIQNLYDGSPTSDFNVGPGFLQFIATSEDGSTFTSFAVTDVGVVTVGGDLQVSGGIYSDNWFTGTVLISAVANTNVGVTVSGLALKAGTYSGFVTANSGDPGTAYESTVLSVTNDGLQIWIHRTNTASTTVHYMVREQD
ncbi:hypothetical protein [Streptomyces sp. NPDC088847]|uniref:hypothetical protein n=1 Tax=Streptomyces sp. NPDC088847 TaxID=3365909 RepID=UPI0037F88815